MQPEGTFVVVCEGGKDMCLQEEEEGDLLT
jgi:hypothetical protein